MRSRSWSTERWSSERRVGVSALGHRAQFGNIRLGRGAHFSNVGFSRGRCLVCHGIPMVLPRRPRFARIFDADGAASYGEINFITQLNTITEPTNSTKQ